MNHIKILLFIFVFSLNNFLLSVKPLQNSNEDKASINKEMLKLSAPILEEAIKLAQKHSMHKNSPKPIISIGGCSAAGKSYFTNQLEELLKKEKIKVKILKMDDFIQPEIVENYLIHKYFDHFRLHKVLCNILNGHEIIEKPIWDHSASISKKKEIVDCYSDIDLILFEGLYVLCDSSNYDFLKYSSLRIFIETSDENLIKWNWERTKKENPLKNINKEEFEKARKIRIKDYHNNIVPTKKNADFIIIKDDNHSYKITRYIQSY